MAGWSGLGGLSPLLSLLFQSVYFWKFFIGNFNSACSQVPKKKVWSPRQHRAQHKRTETKSWNQISDNNLQDCLDYWIEYNSRLRLIVIPLEWVLRNYFLLERMNFPYHPIQLEHNKSTMYSQLSTFFLLLLLWRNNKLVNYRQTQFHIKTHPALLLSIVKM